MHIMYIITERSQFYSNSKVYAAGEHEGIPIPGFSRDGTRDSRLEYLLRETEQMHGRVRRYTSPDEHPFYPGE